MTNLSVSYEDLYGTPSNQIIIEHRGISEAEIILVITGFIFTAYWYYKVTKNKEAYEEWINPNGNKVNLYKVMRRLFWWYTITTIILGTTQIILAK